MEKESKKITEESKPTSLKNKSSAKKYRKKNFARFIIIAIPLFFLLIYLILQSVLRSNWLRENVGQIASEQLKATTEVQKLTGNLWRHLWIQGLKVDSATPGNPAFMKVEEIEVQYNLTNLLNKEIENISILRPELRLSLDESVLWNLPPGLFEESGSSYPIPNVSIEDGRIFVDGAGKLFEIRELNLSLSTLPPTGKRKNFQFQMKGLSAALQSAFTARGTVWSEDERIGFDLFIKIPETHLLPVDQWLKPYLPKNIGFNIQQDSTELRVIYDPPRSTLTLETGIHKISVQSGTQSLNLENIKLTLDSESILESHLTVIAKTFGIDLGPLGNFQVNGGLSQDPKIELQKISIEGNRISLQEVQKLFKDWLPADFEMGGEVSKLTLESNGKYDDWMDVSLNSIWEKPEVKIPKTLLNNSYPGGSKTDGRIKLEESIEFFTQAKVHAKSGQLKFENFSFSVGELFSLSGSATVESSTKPYQGTFDFELETQSFAPWIQLFDDVGWDIPVSRAEGQLNLLGKGSLIGNQWKARVETKIANGFIENTSGQLQGIEFNAVADLIKESTYPRGTINWELKQSQGITPGFQWNDLSVEASSQLQEQGFITSKVNLHLNHADFVFSTQNKLPLNDLKINLHAISKLEQNQWEFPNLKIQSQLLPKINLSAEIRSSTPYKLHCNLKSPQMDLQSVQKFIQPLLQNQENLGVVKGTGSIEINTQIELDKIEAKGNFQIKTLINNFAWNLRADPQSTILADTISFELNSNLKNDKSKIEGLGLLEINIPELQMGEWLMTGFQKKLDLPILGDLLPSQGSLLDFSIDQLNAAYIENGTLTVSVEEILGVTPYQVSGIHTFSKFSSDLLAPSIQFQQGKIISKEFPELTFNGNFLMNNETTWNVQWKSEDFSLSDSELFYWDYFPESFLSYWEVDGSGSLMGSLSGVSSGETMMNTQGHLHDVIYNSTDYLYMGTGIQAEGVLSSTFNLQDLSKIDSSMSFNLIGEEFLADLVYLNLNGLGLSLQGQGTLFPEQRKCENLHATLDLQPFGEFNLSGLIEEVSGLPQTDLNLNIPNFKLGEFYERLISPDDGLGQIHPMLDNTRVSGLIDANIAISGSTESWEISGRIYQSSGYLAFNAESSIFMEDFTLDLPFLFTSHRKDLILEDYIKAPTGRLSLQNMILGPLQMGSQELSFQFYNNDFRIPESHRLPFYRGTIEIEQLELLDIFSEEKLLNFDLQLQDVQLEKIASDMLLPPLSGTISTNLPEFYTVGNDLVAYEKGSINIFSGTVEIWDMKVENIFESPMARFSSEYRDINLYELSTVLQYGRAYGIIKGSVKNFYGGSQGLRDFNAVIRSVPRKGVPQKLSVEAVEAIVGPGIGSAEKAFLRKNDSYSYSDLGIQFRLVDGRLYSEDVLSGIYSEEGSFEFMKGKGFLNRLNINIQPPPDGIDFNYYLDYLKRNIERITEQGLNVNW